MLDREITIAIPGHAAPKGSMKCVGGRGKVKHQLVEDNARSQPWRDLVAQAIRRHWPPDAYAERHQPVGAEVTVTLPRPAGHYGTGRNAGTLRPGIRGVYPVTRSAGDVDKLLRLILDAVQDTDVLPDDAAVCEATARKAYVAPDGPDDVLGYPGVVIRLWPL